MLQCGLLLLNFSFDILFISLLIYNFSVLERVMRIELTQPAWKAGVLPLNYTRVKGVFTYLGFEFKCFYGGGGRIRTFEG